MKRLRFLMIAALAAVGILGVAPPAQAQFAINIVSGAINVTVFDGGAGDLNPAPNAITVVSGAGGVPAIPGITTNVDTAVTNTPGNLEGAVVDLTYTLSSLGNTGGTVQITASATGFTTPGPAFNPLTLESDFAGNGLGTFSITGQSWLNTANALFGLGPFTPGPQGPFTTSPYGSVATVTGDVTGLYSLTNRVTATVGANSLVTGDIQAKVTGIPAPAGLLLALGGVPVLGVGALVRRRWAKKA